MVKVKEASKLGGTCCARQPERLRFWQAPSLQLPLSQHGSRLRDAVRPLPRRWQHSASCDCKRRRFRSFPRLPRASVFADMFSISSAPDSDTQENYEGAPLVRMYDDAKDAGDMLRMLLTLAYVPSCSQQSPTNARTQPHPNLSLGSICTSRTRGTARTRDQV